MGLLFGKAAPLGGDFAFPAAGSHAFGEIILTSVGAFRRVIVGLLTIGEADLLPFRACWFAAKVGAVVMGTHITSIRKIAPIQHRMMASPPISNAVASADGTANRIR